MEHDKHSNPYPKFIAMIVTSTVVMFGLMYLNTYALDHVFFSETRTYMAIYMGATMAIIMLAFMLGMYKNAKANLAIFAGSALIFAVALWLVRSQVTVEDRLVDEGDDSASLDRHSHERASEDHRSAGPQISRRNHRSATPGDRGDEGVDPEPGEQGQMS